MCLILHIETATEVCSVSLAREGKAIACKETLEGRSHASLLSVFIQELFNETGLLTHSLNAIAVSMGPGSYTGLRIGVSTAKGLCYGLNIPLIAVPTLQSMCFGMIEKITDEKYYKQENVLLVPMIDARRMEVYTAIYTKDMKVIKSTDALIINSTTFNEWLQYNTLIFFGNGADKLINTIVHPHASFILDYKISSTYMSALAYTKYKNKDFVDVAYFEPYYVKDFITTTPKKKLDF